MIIKILQNMALGGVRYNANDVVTITDPSTIGQAHGLSRLGWLQIIEHNPAEVAESRDLSNYRSVTAPEPAKAAAPKPPAAKKPRSPRNRSKAKS